MEHSGPHKTDFTQLQAGRQCAQLCDARCSCVISFHSAVLAVLLPAITMAAAATAPCAALWLRLWRWLRRFAPPVFSIRAVRAGAWASAKAAPERGLAVAGSVYGLCRVCLRARGGGGCPCAAVCLRARRAAAAARRHCCLWAWRRFPPGACGV